MAADVGAALSAWLSEREGRAVEVRGLAMASAGARRVNALFDAVTSDGTRRLALTMIPTAAIQLLDVRAEAEVRLAAEAAGVPVPHVHHVCEDDAVLGGPFFLSTAVDGETVTSTGLDKATVTVEVLGATKGPKIIIQKSKNKTGYKKRQAHRQKYTQVKVTDISL